MSQWGQQQGRRKRFSVSTSTHTHNQNTHPPTPTPDTYASTVAFSDYAHWLIPGHLMAGRYPYVEPSRVSSRSVGEAQLDEIMRAGITRFVCLQAELPPQADMPVGGKDGFLPYRPTATLIAAALSGPPSLEVMEGLRNPHLDTFLPPRRKKDRHAADPVHVAAAAERSRVEVSFGHCPIPDLGVPESGIAAALVDDVIARLSAGERIYLHCWGGRGRAGTIGACVLGKLYSVSAEEALARVDAALRTREPDGRSPEKEEQREFVRAFLGK